MIDQIVNITKDDSGLEYLEVQNTYAVAKIALQGGHVVWWRIIFVAPFLS